MATKSLQLVLYTEKGSEITPIHREAVGRDGVGQEVFKGHSSVSRLHAMFYRDNQFWYVEDLDSFNGTFLNGEKLQAGKKYPIKNGDTLYLSSSFKLECKIF
ncbi:MAG: FHA domain-containing protein [Leptospiraceae bacterium]|nr:FHA domain-containing protein [Leptospiraceae bacterium]MCP5502339.1 FHA domain-containing protein [Leptospiraceae bacterium]